MKYTPSNSYSEDNSIVLTLSILTLHKNRFHWRGYVGCSKGYSLDSYVSMNIRSNNSLVNEQAKDQGTAGLYTLSMSMKKRVFW